MALETIYACVCWGCLQQEQHEEQPHHLCTPAIEHLAVNNKENAPVPLQLQRAREAAVAAATDK